MMIAAAIGIVTFVAGLTTARLLRGRPARPPQELDRLLHSASDRESGGSLVWTAISLLVLLIAMGQAHL